MTESKLSTTWVKRFCIAMIFMVMLLIIALVFPHKTGAFPYHFEEGRPWAYGLMTAQYDFPIYKPAEQLKAEQREALKDFAPYFTLDPKVQDDRLQALRAATAHLSSAEQSLIIKQVNTLYRQGIFRHEQLEQLKREGYSAVTLVNHRHITTTIPIDVCHTPRTAYESLMQSPEEVALLHDLQINRFLVPNLHFDSTTTQVMRQKRIDRVAVSSGMVQKGEKIIDRGEIVDAHTYQILLSLKQTMEEAGIDTRRAIWSLCGTLCLIAIFIALMAFYLWVFRPQLFSDFRSLLFFAILMTTIIVIAAVVERFTALSIYIVPFAWVPIITRVFYDSRTALYVHMVTTLICSFMAPVPFEFLVLQMAAGMVAVSSLRDMAQRSQLVQTAILIVLSYSLCYTAFILAIKGSPDMLHWHTYCYFAANGLLLVFSYGLIYIFEKAFRLVSSITLVELTNVNSDFMLRFAEQAPGTFQHSLQVSNLAIEASKRIGANTLLVRAGALYHDIGKLYAPEYFTENQQTGLNPLMEMSHVQAAQAVIAHVTKGIQMGEKEHLPEVILRFIRTHHGTSKTRFFYNSYANAHPGEPVNEALFTYSGPKPDTKETAILMMADAVEARSRSLTEYTEESIRQMVEQMITAQQNEGQFEDTPLTFRDISIIKDTFAKKLISMNHHRIAYPELKLL